MVKKENIEDTRNLFVMKSCESLEMPEASYEIAFLLAKEHMPFSGGEDNLSPVSINFLNVFGIKVLKERQTRSLFQGRQLHDALQSLLMMHPSIWRTLSIRALSFH